MLRQVAARRRPGRSRGCRQKPDDAGWLHRSQPALAEAASPLCHAQDPGGWDDREVRLRSTAGWLTPHSADKDKKFEETPTLPVHPQIKLALEALAKANLPPI